MWSNARTVFKTNRTQPQPAGDHKRHACYRGCQAEDDEDQKFQKGKIAGRLGGIVCRRMRCSVGGRRSGKSTRRVRGACSTDGLWLYNGGPADQRARSTSSAAAKSGRQRTFLFSVPLIGWRPTWSSTHSSSSRLIRSVKRPPSGHQFAISGDPEFLNRRCLTQRQ